MPPKTASSKEKPVKGAEDGSEVSTVSDVSANLKGKVTKPEAQRALTALAEKGSLTMKPYGKQTIFVYKQCTVLDSSNLDRIDERIKSTQASLEERRKELRHLTQEEQELNGSPATLELNSLLSRLQDENHATRTALTLQGQPSKATVSREEADRIDSSWDKWRREWIARRKVYKQLIGALEDAGTDRAQLEEAKGIEQDDDDAKEVEKSELCKPTITQRPRTARPARTPQLLGKRPHEAATEAL